MYTEPQYEVIREASNRENTPSGEECSKDGYSLVMENLLEHGPEFSEDGAIQVGYPEEYLEDQESENIELENFLPKIVEGTLLPTEPQEEVNGEALKRYNTPSSEEDCSKDEYSLDMESLLEHI